MQKVQISAVVLIVGITTMFPVVGQDSPAIDSLPVQEAVPAPVTVDDTSLSVSPDALEKPKDSTMGFADLAEAARYDSLWLEVLNTRTPYFKEMNEAVREMDKEVLPEGEFNTLILKERLARLNEKTPFDISYNPSLERVIRHFITNKKELMQRMLSASQFYFPLFEQELDNHNIPLELKYLAIVESALNPRAKSRVGATGLWQFMYGTGKMYDLDVSSYVDERSDPILATRAACKYLAKLYDIFGDWDLALAAYNSGPGNVNKAIRRSGGYTNYWNIRRNLPRETAGYVPAFLATMYVFEYAAEHGISPKEAVRPYFETDTVLVKDMIAFDQIARILDVSVKELELLNPAYKLNIIPKIKGKSYILRLPKRVIGPFVNNEEAIYALATDEFSSKERPVPQLVEAQSRIRYKVRSGDYLGKIAERYGVGVSQIKRWNGLRSSKLRIGQRLTIYPRKPVTAATTKREPSGGSNNLAGTSKIHVVRKGDSLWTISRKYPGVTIEKLREWNGIRGNNLVPGTKLKLCDCPS